MSVFQPVLLALKSAVGNRYVFPSADANGYVNVNVAAGGASGGTSSTFGAAFPATGTAAGFKDSTGALLAPGNLDASGNLKVAGSLSVTPTVAATSTLSNVADSATSVTLLAANAARYGFRIYNDSTVDLTIKLGTTASATSLTEKLLPGQSWGTAEIGVNYTGRIDGIWASAPGGAARVTELTA